MSARTLPVWVRGVGSARAGRIGVDALFAGAWGTLAFALFAGKYIVKTTHPVLGTIAGLFSLWNAADLVATAADTTAGVGGQKKAA